MDIKDIARHILQTTQVYATSSVVAGTAQREQEMEIYQEHIGRMNEAEAQLIETLTKFQNGLTPIKRSDLRRVQYGRLVGHTKDAYFHHWLKEFSDDMQRERSGALIEFEDGTLEEVSVNDIRFIN